LQPNIKIVSGSGKAAMNKVNIIIPVYNEAENIRRAVERIEAAVTMPHAIAVVYDTEEDTTLPVVRDMQKTVQGIELLKNKYGRGPLNAIKTGLEAASGAYALVTMADLSDPPEVMNALYEKAEAEHADIVCASRYMKDGKQTGGPLIKGWLSRIAGITLHYFAKLPTHDATNSFKLYRVSFLKTQTIESSGGFELGIELVAKAFAGGYKIAETPTTWTDRVEGKSNFRLFRWLKNYIHWYIYIFAARQKGLLRYTPRFVFYAASGGVCALINWTFFYALHYTAHIPYLKAAAGAFVLSATANYALCTLIFKSKGQRKLTEYILVLAASAAALLIDLGVMYALIERFRFSPMIAKIPGTGTAFLFNYTAWQFFIFSPEHK
jgi:glycosyltransferase involved in cell wall biosynthesis